MKLKNILYTSLALMSLTACNDYLDVDAPSKVTDEYVFSNTEEADRLLNSVYTSLCSSNTYGNAYMTTFCLNSDVEFTTSSAETKSAGHNEWKLFDGEADGSNVQSTWTAAYQTIERANNFVNAGEASELYKSGDKDIIQMVGEAKCIRAMNYLDLVIMFGDIPFTFTRTYDQGSLVMPMGNRDQILSALIVDLMEIAPKMKPAATITEGVERCSQEYAYALIARIAMFRAGYSLRHKDGDASKNGIFMARAAEGNPVNYVDENGVSQVAKSADDFYKVARLYAKKVMDMGSHKLGKDYFDVFVDECKYTVNNDDDVIFEIPFVQKVNGNVGYVHGIRCDLSSASDTNHPWGRTGGNVRLNAFYRFSFAESDVRRNVAGYWTWNYDGTPTLFSDYGNYCLKWSKFWDANATLGNTSEGNTGINFPYMRYADVLLMFAEAENEVNGPTEAAKSALMAVRERAFRGAADKNEQVVNYVASLSSKDSFFKAIVDERKWEFGGENLRWKDLVRWNLYSEVIWKNFWKYYGKGTDDTSYEDYDGEFMSYPASVYYKVMTRAQWNEAIADGTVKAEDHPEVSSMPMATCTNSQMKVLVFHNYISGTTTKNTSCLWSNYLGTDVELTPSTAGTGAWTQGYLFNWLDDATSIAKAPCRCSVRGYIYINEEGTLIPASMPDYTPGAATPELPAVRYILPIPSEVIDYSKGSYKNYYGY